MTLFLLFVGHLYALAFLTTFLYCSSFAWGVRAQTRARNHCYWIATALKAGSCDYVLILVKSSRFFSVLQVNCSSSPPTSKTFKTVSPQGPRYACSPFTPPWPSLPKGTCQRQLLFGSSSDSYDARACLVGQLEKGYLFLSPEKLYYWIELGPNHDSDFKDSS